MLLKMDRWPNPIVTALMISMLLASGCDQGDDDDDDVADDDSADDDTFESLLPGIYVLDGTGVDLPYDDLGPFGAFVGDAQVVALGESAHAAGGMLQTKVVLSAHSLHVNMNSEAIDMVYPAPGAEYDFWEYTVRMGNWIAAEIGDGYLPLSIVAYQHNWDDTVVTPPPDELDDMPEGPEIVELMLHDLGEPMLFVDLAFPGTDDPFLVPAEEYRLIYPQPMMGDIVTGVIQTVPADLFAGMVFLEEVEDWEQIW